MSIADLADWTVEVINVTADNIADFADFTVAVNGTGGGGGGGGTGQNPTFVQVTSNRNVNGSANNIIPMPGPLAIGDIAVAYVQLSLNNTTITGPTGWTRLDSTDSTSINAAGTWVRVIDGTESSSYTWVGSTSAGILFGAIIAYTAVSAVSVDAHALPDTQISNTSPEAPSVTATGAADLWVTFVSTITQTSLANVPPGFTNRATINFAGTRNIFIYDLQLIAAGATGTADYTLATADFWMAASVLLKT